MNKSESQEASAKTAQEIQSLTGISHEFLNQAVKAGFVPRPKGGKYSLGPTLVQLVKFEEDLRTKAGGLPVYDSMAQCAARTRIPITVLKRMKKSGSRAFKNSRVALGPLLEDLFAGNDEDKNWRGHYDKYHALREELRHSHEADATLRKEDVTFTISKGLSQVCSQLDRAANIEWPPELKGLDEHGCQAVLTKRISKIIEGLREEWSTLAADRK